MDDWEGDGNGPRFGRKEPTTKRDFFSRQGMMMAEIVELKEKTRELEGRVILLEDQTQILVPRVRRSLRAPAVQSTGVAAAVSATLVIIFEAMRALGIIK